MMKYFQEYGIKISPFPVHLKGRKKIKWKEKLGEKKWGETGKWRGRERKEKWQERRNVKWGGRSGKNSIRFNNESNTKKVKYWFIWQLVIVSNYWYNWIRQIELSEGNFSWVKLFPTNAYTWMGVIISIIVSAFRSMGESLLYSLIPHRGTVTTWWLSPAFI